MSGFSIDWLDLREAADRRARDNGLLKQAVQWLLADPAPETHPVAVDLGAGTGSTLRTFAANGIGSATLAWRLVDHDQNLLTEAQHRHGNEYPLETHVADLARVNALPLKGARLVTASALFDLVSADFIEALSSCVQAHGQDSPCGVYAALNYDGVTRWNPVHPLDDAVLVAFNQDQRRDKGFGPALGPQAGTCMARLFTRAGFIVQSASSPWLLGANDQAMVAALIEGIASAVAPKLEPLSLKEWVEFRQSYLITGTCEVGHTDILALPASSLSADL